MDSSFVGFVSGCKSFLSKIRRVNKVNLRLFFRVVYLGNPAIAGSKLVKLVS